MRIVAVINIALSAYAFEFGSLIGHNYKGSWWCLFNMAVALMLYRLADKDAKKGKKDA